jgi:hypothetical protein
MSNPKRVTVDPASTDGKTVEAFAVGDAETAAVPAPEVEVGPKKVKARASKVKPCVRCEERRAREREYAKSSRLRLRLAAATQTSASNGEPSAPDAAAASEEGATATAPPA